MQYMADIVIYDAKGQLAAVVEVKRKLGATAAWAAQMRRNMLSHERLPDNIPFFLLALPDRFYLWEHVDSTPEVRAPTYEIDPAPYLEPYYEKSGTTRETISEHNLELIILSWLNELQLTPPAFAIKSEYEEEWLYQSGLLETIQNGKVESEALAYEYLR